MTMLLNGLLVLLLILYPLGVYFGLKYWDLRTVAIVLIALMSVRAFTVMRSKNNAFGQNSLWLLVAAVILLVLVLVFNDIIYFKFYPLVVNVSFFMLFALSLMRPPSMIERLAKLQDPELPEEAVIYTRKVTFAWCLFFIVNGSISLFTACCAPLEIWTLYNGLISYVLIGLLFAVEWLVRQYVKK